MDRPPQPCGLQFGMPATYRIFVQGSLDERVAAHVGDVSIVRVDAHSAQIVVRVKDQAGLSGVLDALYGLHLSILSLQLLDDEEKYCP